MMSLAACALLACPLFGCGHRPAGATPVRLAVARSPFTYLPVYLAEPLGYFKQEGLSVTVAELSGGAQAIQSIMGGSADIAAGFYEHAIEITAAGKPLRFIPDHASISRDGAGGVAEGRAAPSPGSRT